MKLIIVESPSKAKKIQEYVGDDYVVLASFGHICDLAKGGKFGIGVDTNNNFKPHYLLMKDKIETLNNIINAADKSELILLAADPDREGEAIAYHLYKYLLSTNKPIKRIKFGEITKNTVLKSIKNMQDIDLNLVKSQEARRILDRIVGFLVSPYLINHYGPNLSAGRVQSVAVRMITDREKEIESFKPDEFWNIFAKFKKQDGCEFLTKFNGRPKIKTEVDNIINNIKKQDEFYVSSIAKQDKKEKPPPPLTTAALQQYMAKEYSFEPDRTMKAAQNLYENGFCTYIRTDSTRSSEDSIESVREWLINNKFDIPKKHNKYETKSSAQDAHECIRPTSMKNDLNNSILSGDDKNVYKAIWEHFIASQMNHAIWNTLNVLVHARADKKIAFNVSGKALSYKGYLEIFGPVDPGKIEIPNMVEGEILNLVNNSIKSEQKFTKPLPRFNDASILKELENRQIGRPATYAEIIKKISNRNYVEKSGNTYRPTDLGKKITNILVNLFKFMEYDYTSNLEKQLDDIADGRIDSINMLNSFFIPFKSKLDEAYKNMGGSTCDKCGGQMITRINSKDKTKFISCNMYPRCRNSKPFSERVINTDI